MKLLVNLVAHGRYWQAGSETPDCEVPAMLRKRKYVMADPDPDPPSDRFPTCAAPTARKRGQEARQEVGAQC